MFVGVIVASILSVAAVEERGFADVFGDKETLRCSPVAVAALVDVEGPDAVDELLSTPEALCAGRTKAGRAVRHIPQITP